MRAPLYSAAIAAVLGLASTAGAQETVYLGGTPPRPGPGDDVLIVPPGSMVTIVNGAALPPLPPPPAPLPPPTVVMSPPPLVLSAQATAWVHLEGRPNLALEAVLPNETDWKRMCTAPCDRRMPIDALYRVTSPGMQTSKTVHLYAQDGEHVTVTVDPTSETTHTGGEALLILGGVGVLAGGILLYVDAVTSGLCATPDSGCSSMPGAVFWTGIGSAAVGAVGIIAGIKMMQPTSVEQSAGPGDVRERAAARDDRYKRSPIWRDALQTETTPKVTSVPIFSTTF
jgi:hypothetical protein